MGGGVLVFTCGNTSLLKYNRILHFVSVLHLQFRCHCLLRSMPTEINNLFVANLIGAQTPRCFSDLGVDKTDQG